VHCCVCVFSHVCLCAFVCECLCIFDVVFVCVFVMLSLRPCGCFGCVCLCVFPVGWCLCCLRGMVVRCDAAFGVGSLLCACECV